MGYVKVYKYKKQYSLDGGVTWQDVTPAEYAPSGEPIGYYDTYEECMAQYRTIQSGTTCVGVDKHNQDVYEVSYDEGATWEVVSTSAGTLIETNSYDCGYRTRTTSGTAYCTGYDKYVDVYSQVSTDYGSTWTTTATTPTLIEADSPDCGYVPPTPTSPKYILTLQDSSTVSAECDSSSAITENDVSAYKDTLVSAEIGDCVTEIGDYAFWDCKSLTSATIGNNVTSIGDYAFEDCKSLTSVEIPDGVTSIGYSVFRNCSGLTSITIPTGVTSISYGTFRYCSSLTSITIPSNVTTIGNGAFRNCSGLTSITVYATTPPTLESQAFDDTNNCPIYVPCESLSAYQSAWSTYASRIQCMPKFILTLNNSSIVTAACDSTSAVTKEEIYSPYGSSVVDAIISDCVISINSKAMWACSALTNVIIGNNVTTIGDYAFAYSNSLTKIVIPDNVTTIGENVLFGCHSLTSCTIGTGVTSISESAFANCSGLTTVTIPNTVTSIERSAFWMCESLTNIEIPSGLTTISESCFTGCDSLTNVTIPSGVTSIEKWAFGSCSGLQSITFLPTTPPTYGANTFYNTNNCTMYVPSDSVNAYKTAWPAYADRIQAIP